MRWSRLFGQFGDEVKLILGFDHAASWSVSAGGAIHPATAAVHADADFGVLQHAGEGKAAELAALVGIDDVGTPEARQRFFQRYDAKANVHCVRQPPRQHFPGCPISGSAQTISLQPRSKRTSAFGHAANGIERQHLRAVAAGQFSVPKPACRVSGAPYRLTTRQLHGLDGLRSGGFLEQQGRKLPFARCRNRSVVTPSRIRKRTAHDRGRRLAGAGRDAARAYAL